MSQYAAIDENLRRLIDQLEHPDHPMTIDQLTAYVGALAEISRDLLAYSKLIAAGEVR